MAKKEIILDEESINAPKEYVQIDTKNYNSNKEIVREYSKSTGVSDNLINCLKNERVIVRFVPKQSGIVTNPKHILYGGMAEGAVRKFSVPKLSSGMFVNVLTDSEKAYLEEIMGLEYNALSVYKKVNNFWDDSSDNGISVVSLTKGDNYFNLSDPEDYIKYKILLANKDFIAPSIQELQDKPKRTYQFVVIQEGDETKNAKKEMSATMQSYMEFGKIQEDYYLLKTIVELLDGRPIAKNTKLDFLQDKVNKLIQADAKLFLKVVSDPLLPTKSLIKRCIEEGLISNRGGYLYLKSDGTPLCEDGDPTLNNAALYLSAPKRQELKFSLEAKLKQ